MSRARPPAASDRSPRHAAAGSDAAPVRPGPPRRTAPLAALGVAVVIAVTSLAFVLQPGSAGGDGAACSDGPRVLRVAAAPEIAPVLAAATARDSRGLLPRAATCLDVRVDARPAGEISAALRSGVDPQADLWIPDSSSWLSGAPGSPRAVLSLASSPVVLGLHRTAALQLGWPRRPVDATDVVRGRGARAHRLGLSPLETSATARLGVLEITRVLGGAADGRTALARILRTADASLPDAPADVLERVRADPALVAPVSEQAVWASAGQAGAPPVVAVYSRATAALDYPLVPLAPGRQDDVAVVRQALSAAEWVARVQAAGFRAADGAAGSALTSQRGVDPRAAAGATAPAADVVAAVRSFDVLTRDVRMLVVLDVSGSMAAAVPGLAGTRMELATSAAGRGLGLLGDGAQVGLWVFSTDVTPTSDHRELVSIGPVGTRRTGVSGREALASALAGVRHLPEGDTGLYDTTLAAVRHVRRGWDPERVNSVVLLTDGRNDDAGSIGLPQLLATLRAEGGQQPVPVVAVAYGPDSDVAALRQISSSTGGTVHAAVDPRRIHEVLQDALSRRACRPDC